MQDKSPSCTFAIGILYVGPNSGLVTKAICYQTFPVETQPKMQGQCLWCSVALAPTDSLPLCVLFQDEPLTCSGSGSRWWRAPCSCSWPPRSSYSPCSTCSPVWAPTPSSPTTPYRWGLTGESPRVGLNVGSMIMGSPMIHVDFKKWPCAMLLFLQCSCRFGKVPCCMSNLGNTFLYVMPFIFAFLSLALCCMSILSTPCRRVEFKGQEPLMWI